MALTYIYVTFLKIWSFTSEATLFWKKKCMLNHTAYNTLSRWSLYVCETLLSLTLSGWSMCQICTDFQMKFAVFHSFIMLSSFICIFQYNEYNTCNFTRHHFVTPAGLKTDMFTKSTELAVEIDNIYTSVRLARDKKGIHIIQFKQPLTPEQRYFSVAVRKAGVLHL